MKTELKKLIEEISGTDKIFNPLDSLFKSFLEVESEEGTLPTIALCISILLLPFHEKGRLDLDDLKSIVEVSNKLFEEIPNPQTIIH